MLEQWQCAQHRMRTVRRRIYAAHLTVCRGIIEQLEQVEIDAFPTAFVTDRPSERT
jgi:phosphoglycolate phosphatase-like HAD superfamily hydrolase